MKYGKIVEGTFIERPNRFIAMVDISGTFIDRPNRFIAICEITDPDTGQCKELLFQHILNTSA